MQNAFLYYKIGSRKMFHDQTVEYFQKMGRKWLNAELYLFSFGGYLTKTEQFLGVQFPSLKLKSSFFTITSSLQYVIFWLLIHI